MKYLGVDFGMKRIGLASSEGELATADKVLVVTTIKAGMEKLLQIAKEYDRIVIGQPGGEIGQKVLKIINTMKKTGFDVVGWDEHLSSQNAKKLMLNLGKGRKDRSVVDAVAAAIILQDYLDYHKQ